MIKILELYLVSLLTIGALYFIWSYGYMYGCAFLFVPLIIFGTISYSYIENRMHDRNCFSKCFIQDNTFISKMLAGSFSVTIIGFIIAVISALPLLSFSLDVELSFAFYIVIHIFALIVVYKYVSIKLENTVNNNYLYILSKKITTIVMSIFIFIVYTYIFMKSNEPFYLKDTFDLSMEAAKNSIHSQCKLIDPLLRFFRELDLINWWLVSHSNDITQSSSFPKILQQVSNVAQPLLWGVFILKNALIAFALNSFFMQIIYVIDKFVFKSIYTEKKEDI